MSSDLGSGTLTLTGSFTLYESSEIRETLLTALAEGRDLRINLEASGPWDIAGLQLLIATVTSAEKSGLHVTFFLVPGVCREAAERSGLTAWLDAYSEPTG